MSRLRRRAVAVLVGTFAALALGSMAGCASDPVVQGRLHAGMDDAPEGRTLFWPTEPEVPRYAYAGTLTVTLVADPEACPDLGRLRDDLQSELDDLTSATARG